MYADQTEHEGRVEEVSLNLAISSSDEAESSRNLNGKLECEPTACLSTGI